MADGRFSLISRIDAQSEVTWKGRIFLSFDIDWAADDVVRDCLDLVRRAGVPATWFATHRSTVLDELLRDPTQEVGLHPNFNPLLQGEAAEPSPSVLSACRALAPAARSVRSHSLVYSERLLDQFKAAGFSHVANSFIPYSGDFPARPYPLWDGMTMVPHCWQDNVALKMDLEFPVRRGFAGEGLVVLDFHPIHVYLNTEHVDRYEGTRPWHREPSRLIGHRHGGYGTRSRLLELLEEAA